MDQLSEKVSRLQQQYPTRDPEMPDELKREIISELNILE